MTSQLRSVKSYREKARQAVAPEMFDAWFGSDRIEMTADTANERAFQDAKLVPRVLTGIDGTDTGCTVLGSRLDIPILLGPAGGQTRFCADGEIASAKAASSANTVFTLPLGSYYTIEEVADAADGPLWFQLYMLADRELNEWVVSRIEKAGFKALMVTVDNTGSTSQERIARFYRGTSKVTPWRNLEHIAEAKRPKSGDFYELVSMTLGWDDIRWLKSITKLPLVVKGIQSGEDARLAADHGVDAIVVSNHGGHTLGSARATLHALSDVVRAAGSEIEILCDGGIRSGEDVLKALALGARAVLVGRAMVWGLMADGQDGVSDVLSVLTAELRRAMRLCGVQSVGSVPDKLVDLSYGRTIIGN